MRPPEAPRLPGGEARWPGPGGTRGALARAPCRRRRRRGLAPAIRLARPPRGAVRAEAWAARARSGGEAWAQPPNCCYRGPPSSGTETAGSGGTWVRRACEVLTPKRCSVGAFRNGKRRPAPPPLPSHFGRVSASRDLGVPIRSGSGGRGGSRPELEGRRGCRPRCAVEPESGVGSRGQRAPFLFGHRLPPGKSWDKTRGRRRWPPGLSNGANLCAAAWEPGSHFLRLLPAPGLDIFKKCESGNLEGEKVYSLGLCPALEVHCKRSHLYV